MTEIFEPIFKGMYPYYAIPAVLVMIYRIRKHLWKKEETILLSIFLCHLILEVFQLRVGSNSWYISRRYLLPCAPLLFGWFAWGIAEIYRRILQEPAVWKFAAALFFVVGGSIFLIIDGINPVIKTYISRKQRHKLEFITTAAERIKLHFGDDPHFIPSQMTANARRYQSPRRPFVCSEEPAIAYFCGGSHMQHRNSCDYLVIKAPAKIPPTFKVVDTVNIDEKIYFIASPVKK